MSTKFLLIMVWAILLSGCSWRGTPHVGVTDGRLLPCPSSPNCASTQKNDIPLSEKALPWEGTLDNAKDRVLSVIRTMKRTKIVSMKEDYIHVECTSFMFRFVDDVEFFFDTQRKIIHLRSASRVGFWDMGANGKRIEKIRKRYFKLIADRDEKRKE